MASVLARTTLKKAGGSLVMTVPAAARNLLHLSEGQEMDVTVEDGRVIVQPVAPVPKPPARKPPYTLEDLLQEFEADDKIPRATEWLEAPPQGQEEW